MSHVPVRSIESWVLEERKYSVCHKPERIPYCPSPVFFSPWLLNQLLSCTYPGNPCLLCYIICSFTLPVIIVTMVGSTSLYICAIPSCCFIFRWLLGLTPKPVLRKVTRVSHSPMRPRCGLPTLLYPPPPASSFCCLCSETCCGDGSQRGRGWGSAGI